jgi:hypothetical protein
VALGCFPPVFGLAGAIIGIVNMTSGSADRRNHGITLLLVSVICAGLGMVIGYLAWQGRFRW